MVSKSRAWEAHDKKNIKWKEKKCYFLKAEEKPEYTSQMKGDKILQTNVEIFGN